LQDCRTTNQIKQALKRLPKTLDQTYDRILEKILKSGNENDANHAQAALMWLVSSERPLTLEELAEAAIVHSPVITIDPADRFFVPTDIMTICKSLVSLIDFQQDQHYMFSNIRACGTSIVRLSHCSVKEYLISERIKHKSEIAVFTKAIQNSPWILAETCITYLLLVDMSVKREFDDLVKHFPLLGYATYFWHRHCVRIEGDDRMILEEVAMPLVKEKYYLLRNSILHLSGNYLINLCPDPNSRPLVYASYYGLDTIVRKLIQAGAKIPDADDINVLVAAAFTGHLSIVELLLKEGADIDAVYPSLGTALAAAAFIGHEPTVKLLLKEGARIDWSDSIVGSLHKNALEAAAAGGHKSLVQLFLDKGVDVNIIGRSTALIAAAYGGFGPVVELLLKAGADINSIDDGDAALSRAADGGHESVVDLLLKYGADIIENTEVSTFLFTNIVLS